MNDDYAIIKEHWQFHEDGSAIRTRHIDGVFYDSVEFDHPPFAISSQTTSITKTSPFIPKDVADALPDNDGIGGTDT